MSNKLNESEIEALKFSVGVIGKWVKENRINIPELDPNLKSVVEAFTPVYQRRGMRHDEQWSRRRLPPNEKLMGYELSELRDEGLVLSYLQNKRAHEYLLQIATENIRLGFPLHEILKQIVIDKLNGGVSAPSDGGTRNVKERNILFVMMAEWMKENLGLPRASDQCFSGADALWAASLSFGVSVTTSQTSKVLRDNNDLRSFYTSHRHLLIAPRAGAVVNAFYDMTPHPSFGPFEQNFKTALEYCGRSLE